MTTPKTKNNNSPKKIVKNLINLGLVPIPLKYKEKYPIHKEWTLTTMKTALDKFKYIGKYNIGILCGKVSGITVIDIDIYKDGVAHQPTLDWYNKYKDLLTKTAYVSTTSNNYHFYFKYNPELPSSNLRSHGINVEIKSAGVQVVAPPSKVKQGEYRWVKEIKSRKDIAILDDTLVKIFSALTIQRMKDKKEGGKVISLDDIPTFLKGYAVVRIRSKDEYIYYDLDKSKNPVPTRMG